MRERSRCCGDFIAMGRIHALYADYSTGGAASGGSRHSDKKRVPATALSAAPEPLRTRLGVKEVIHNHQIDAARFVGSQGGVSRRDLHVAYNLARVELHPRNDNDPLATVPTGCEECTSEWLPKSKNWMLVTFARSTSVKTAPNAVVNAGVTDPGTGKVHVENVASNGGEKSLCG